MPRIPEAKLDEVRDATDIVDLIAGYIPLKRAGNGYSALCPFHNEKTASFHVWPETQTWKCFGCGRGGNAYHFVMEKEGLGFAEAVRQLAREAGITIAASERDEEVEGERERILRVLDWACRFFESRIRSEDGAKAAEYCKSRGIEGETAARFRVGYAPAGWRGLLDAATARGIEESLLLDAGLVRAGRNEPYDWFRDRLIFPIQDARGRVIGFGGRALGDDEPKYLNSPDTAVFKKGGTLYALHLAKEQVLKDRRIGIMEGYTDVLMAHQHGLTWTVAGLGTGLTREHAQKARRFAERVDLIYDGDEAGLKAAERAVSAFLAVEADVRVVEMPPGEDPCDFLVQRGPSAFLARIEEGREAFDFLLDRARGRNDLSALSGQAAAVDEVLATVAQVKNDVMRDLLLSQLSNVFNVSESSVRKRLLIFRGRGDALETPSGSELAGAVAEVPEERLLAEALLFRPALARRIGKEWPPERFAHPHYREIAKRAAELAGGDGEYSAAALAGRFRDPAVGRVAAELLVTGREKPDLDRQFDDCLARLKRAASLERVRAALARARESGDREELESLQRELFRLRGRGG